MSAGTMQAASRVPGRTAAWAGLAVGAAALLLLFHAEAAAAVGVWIASTAFGHCFLVIPIAAWLAWERWPGAAALPARPTPWAGLAMLPLAAAWLLADRLGIMEGRQLMAMAMLQVLAFAVLGWALYRAFMAPLLYLFFLVPFGGFLVPVLQNFTARFVAVGLDVLAIPNVVTQFIIEIPEGTFRVAEACAGLRFLIAAIAFGVLYACLIYRGAAKRLVFIAASVAVPIVANGFRALGIVVLGHVLGSAQAAAVDHVLYGWLFFSLVILILIATGLPFREDREPFRAVSTLPAPSPDRPALAVAAVLLAVLLAALAPAAAGLLDRGGDAQAARARGAALLAALVVPQGCVAMHGDGAVLLCGAASVALQADLFPAASGAGAVQAATRQALAGSGSEAEDDRNFRAGEGGPVWHLTPDGRRSLGWLGVAAWLGGQPSTGLAARAAQAWANVDGGSLAPVLLVAHAIPAASGATPSVVLAMLQYVLAAQAPLYARIDAAARTGHPG